MKSSPWLAVAVYARAPVAEAPMATDIAANSDSTLMNSHGASCPLFTSVESAATMCVCGEMGYAQMTSGLDSATASATAREPSTCLSTGDLPDLLTHELESAFCAGDVAVREPSCESVTYGRNDRREGDHACEGGESA